MRRAQRRVQREATLTRAVLAFNGSHCVGSEVRVWAGTVGVGPGALRTVLYPGAYLEPGRGPVVLLSGLRVATPIAQVRGARADVASSFDS